MKPKMGDSWAAEGQAKKCTPPLSLFLAPSLCSQVYAQSLVLKAVQISRNHMWGRERVSSESQYMITLFLFFLNYVFGHFYIFYLFKLKVWTPLFGLFAFYYLTHFMTLTR